MRGFSVKLLMMLLCLSACKPSLPEGILSESKMESVLYDYHLAMGLAESEEGSVPENRYIRVRQVFEKHNISEAEFDSSMVYWCEHAETLKEIMKRVSLRLDRKAEALGVSSEQQISDAYSALTSEGDTANIWLGPNFRLVLATTRQNVFRFIIDADSTFRPGDTFLWAFTPQTLSSKGQQDAYVQFSVQYEGDSTVAVSRTIYDDRPVTVEIGERLIRKGSHIRQVSGCVYLPPALKGQFAVTSLRHIALVRYHHEPPVVVEDSVDTELEVDSIVEDTSEHVRLTPHEVRGSGAKEHTINIVKEKNSKWVRRKKRK
jgi:hypothetical protein